jgi:hypothetical protein
MFTRLGLIGVTLSLSLTVAMCDPNQRSGDPPVDGPCSDVGVPDADGDGIPDIVEGVGTVDTDRDGIDDMRDLDSDGDGRSDADESGMVECEGTPRDSDLDGTPDYLDLDSDENGYLDAEESDHDLDHDEIPDWRDPDDDGDEISDRIEIGEDPLDPADTDGDGVPDYHDTDSDGDTILDRYEGRDDPDSDGLGNWRDLDSDGDTLSDEDESGGHPGEEPVDSDDDGTPDYLDRDSDNDLLPDWQESELRTDPTDPDTDNDAYTDFREHMCGTDPTDGSDYPEHGPCVDGGCGPTELCGEAGSGDGADNDCDGQVDETCECPSLGATQACYIGPPATRGNGSCADGTQTCTEILGWSECVGSVLPQPEVCGDGVDQNCDGLDEPCCEPYPDCLCVPGAMRYCDTPMYCSWGIQYCNEDGLSWGPCDESLTGPEGCPGTMFDFECCIRSDACCQDYFDSDGDGDRSESMGACEDVVCLRCECEEGDTRYCGSWSIPGWGIQECEESELGWIWGACGPSTPPEPCMDYPTYYDWEGSGGAVRCCVDSGYCCQDATDIDFDENTSESLGSCPEPECCL